MLDSTGEAVGIWAAVLGLAAFTVAARVLHLGEGFAVAAVAVSALAYAAWWWWA